MKPLLIAGAVFMALYILMQNQQPPMSTAPSGPTARRSPAGNCIASLRYGATPGLQSVFDGTQGKSAPPPLGQDFLLNPYIQSGRPGIRPAWAS